MDVPLLLGYSIGALTSGVLLAQVLYSDVISLDTHYAYCACFVSDERLSDCLSEFRPLSYLDISYLMLSYAIRFMCIVGISRPSMQKRKSKCLHLLFRFIHKT